MRKGARTKQTVGKEPLYRFVLNPFTDYKCTQCPKCDAVTKLRQVPLLIHIDPANLCVVRQPVRVCPPCEILIVQQDLLEEELDSAFIESVRASTGNPYVLLGTIELADWRRSMKETTPAVGMLAQHHPFKGELELRLSLPGWFPAGAAPVVRSSFERGAPRSLGAPPPNVKKRECFRLSIRLDGVAPEIRRSLYVPIDIPLTTLHRVIQVTMGWQDYHLHLFRISGRDYMLPGEDPLENELDEAGVRLSEVVKVGDTFTYLYDFGDEWEHTVTVEGTAEGLLVQAPVCLQGTRACPPEDCGGTRGYQNLLRILANPRHEEYRDMRTWAGPRFDPEKFDLERANRLLQRVRS